MSTMKSRKIWGGVSVIGAFLIMGAMVFGITGAASSTSQEVEVRVSAKRLADGRTEFAVQQRDGNGEWSDRILPSRRLLSATPPVGRWIPSTPVSVTAPTASTPAPRSQAQTVQISGSGSVTKNIRLSKGLWYCDVESSDLNAVSLRGRDEEGSAGWGESWYHTNQHGVQVGDGLFEVIPGIVDVDMYAEGRWTLECTRQ